MSLASTLLLGFAGWLAYDHPQERHVSIAAGSRTAESYKLAQALQKERKSFDLQVGPDKGHEALNRDRMMEFFIENLVVRPPAPLP